MFYYLLFMTFIVIGAEGLFVKAWVELQFGIPFAALYLFW